MSITTLSSREFQQNASHAQKAAQNGPVFITSRGKPVHVLLSIEEYRRITGKRPNIGDLLGMPGIADIELELPKRDRVAPGARPLLNVSPRLGDSGSSDRKDRRSPGGSRPASQAWP